MSVESIDFNLDENNEIIFEIEISSNEMIQESKARFLCEFKDFSLVFNGKIDGNRVTVNVPRLKGIIKESTISKSVLEVFLNNKYFQVLNVESNFIESVKVTKASIVSESVVKKPMIKEVINASVIRKPPLQLKPKTIQEKRNRKSISSQIDRELEESLKELGEFLDD